MTARARQFRYVLLLLLAAAAMMPVHALADDTVPMPGDRTVGHICSVCHGAGLLGAPKIGDAIAWQARLRRAGSVDKLVDSAAHGRGNMPPRGGQSKLTDQDLKAAIQYMLSKSGDY